MSIIYKSSKVVVGAVMRKRLPLELLRTAIFSRLRLSDITKSNFDSSNFHSYSSVTNLYSTLFITSIAAPNFLHSYTYIFAAILKTYYILASNLSLYVRE